MEEKDLKESELYLKAYGEKTGWLWMVICGVIAVLALLYSFARLYVYRNFGAVIVDGDSMNMTLFDDEVLLLRRTQDGAVADYGDVIVVYVGGYQEWQDGGTTNYIIKRLIAKEGDRVRSRNGKISVWKDWKNGGDWEELSEPYAHCLIPADYDDFEYVVEDGEIFFLGDNRLNSEDSRYAQGYSKIDRLYKESDIYGVVPQWAIDYRAGIEFFFLQNVREND